MRSSECERMAGDSIKRGLSSAISGGNVKAGNGGNLSGSNRKLSICMGCNCQIHDQFILRVAPNLEWHAACLKCCECQRFLDENCTCFVREGKTFCKDDYVRLFGAKCDKCLKCFGKSDFVMRAKSKIFHLDCFRCVACERKLQPGDEFSLRHDEIYCKEDSASPVSVAGPEGNVNLVPAITDKKEPFESNNNSILQHNTSNSSENSEAPCDLSDEDMSVIDSQDEMGSSGSKHKGMSTPSGLAGPSGAGSKKGGDRKSARARTVLSEKQLHILKTCYANNARPDALMKEQLVEMTGLSPRVIRVWFQNKRCKDKKIQNRMIEKQMQRETDGRKLGYGVMHGIPMVATSPVRHESPVGMNPVEIQGYEPPWKVLADFALHTDLDRLNPNTPHFQHLVNQMHGYPDLGHHDLHGMPMPPSAGELLPHGPHGPLPFHGPDMVGPPDAFLRLPPPGADLPYLDGPDRGVSPTELVPQSEAEV